MNEKIENLIDNLLDLIKEGQLEAVMETLPEAYESLVAQYRPVLKTLPGLVGAIFQDIAILRPAFYEGYNAIKGNKAGQDLADKVVKLQAAEDARAMVIYQAAGFSREEAVLLLLARKEAFESLKSKINTAVNKVKD